MKNLGMFWVPGHSIALESPLTKKKKKIKLRSCSYTVINTKMELFLALRDNLNAELVN